MHSRPTCSWLRIVSCALRLWRRRWAAQHHALQRLTQQQGCRAPLPGPPSCPAAGCSALSLAASHELQSTCLQGANYRLEYIKEAVAEADAVTKLTGLMKQRRRWLNGTFFAMLYALGNMGRIWTESAHSVGRKLTLTAEFMYLIVNLVVGTW